MPMVNLGKKHSMVTVGPNEQKTSKKNNGYSTVTLTVRRGINPPIIRQMDALNFFTNS